MLNPTAGWDRVGDSYYRKAQVYTSVFDHDLELENYVVVGAPYGGCIALIRNDEKLHSYRGSQAVKSSIDLYSCAGKLIRRINWDKGLVKGIGWSEDERLLVVTEDGTVRSFYNLQGDFTQFSLGHGAEQYGVKSCRFWNSGFVALLSNNSLISVSRYDEPRPALLAKPPEDEVHAWTLIPPAYSLSRSVEVLLAIGKSTYVVDATDCEDRMLQDGPFKRISVSPNGNFISLYTEDGKVWVVSSDFQDKLSEYATKARTVPEELQWCGNDAVVLAWDDELHIAGPNGAVSKHFYDGKIHLLPDVDGIRIIGSDFCEFLQKVPEPVEEVFKLGSTSPAAVLLDAVDQLEKKSPKADDNIQLIKASLSEAVDTCVAAAGYEFSVQWQKQLLKAASFGKSVLELYNSDDFVDMCELLRVFNAVRHYKIGLPLSYDQFVRLTPERLIRRLIDRHEYQLALQISDFLRLTKSEIYIHWASQKVRVSSESEENICRAIVQKVNGKPGISFERIARAAYDEGRGRLATELLNLEPRADRQVPLLLSKEEDELALDKAIESGDTDLVLLVLLHIKDKLPLASFFRAINTRPMASALVESSAKRHGDIDLLKDLYYQDDRRLDGANVLVGQALEQHGLNETIEKLRLATKLLQDSKDHSFETRSIDEASRLMKLQVSYDKDLQSDSSEQQQGQHQRQDRFIGLSLHETIFRLVSLGQASRAKKVQADFKVPDKTFTWLRLRALVYRRDWVALEDWGKNTRKSPIGWEPFYNEVLGAGNSRLAAIFVPKCTNVTASERSEMWLKCGMVVKAAEEVAKSKDVNALEALKAKASGSAVSEIERMLAELKHGR